MIENSRACARDLNLPEWGPYNKNFVGFSHIADAQKGLRFDVDLFPGFYRRSVMQTKTIADGGAKLWQARSDLAHFVYRYELAPDVLCDVHVTSSGGAAQARCVFVNDGDIPESLQLDLCLSIRLPTFMKQPLLSSDVRLSQGAVWVNAAEYRSLGGAFAIAQDGMRRGEEPAAYAVDGFALRLCAAPEAVRAVYAVSPAPALTLRYQAARRACLLINRQPVFLPATPDWALISVPLAAPCEEVVLEMAEGECLVDGFALGDAGSAHFVPRPSVYVPETTQHGRTLTLHYPELKRTYTVEWDTPDCFIRRLDGAHDDAILSSFIHNHVSANLSGDGEGCYSDLFIRPVFLPPHSQKTVCVRFRTGESVGTDIPEKELPVPQPNPVGEPYAFSIQLLTASTLVNVVYPQYFRGHYIKHNTPGKVWDSFYTWDSGMIALGLFSLDEERSIDCLNTYLLPEGDPHSPYLNHGTPLPTQMFALKELLDRGRLDVCRAFYPRLRQFYRYLASLPAQGKCAAGLISTWHIFYNSGGWDDYPPQVETHRRHIEECCAPIISTACAILLAKILQMAAEALGFEADVPGYEQDAARMQAALAPAWDEESGYFGYALCDASGRFAGILRTESGVSFNMGLDGAYPLIAGAVTAHQRARLLENIRAGLLTPFGISVVDTRAPYFSRSGYWNGSVWIPHQWILWKGLLDQGEYALANDIALTALRLWKVEADRTHNCYEHFMLENGRGAGFHHFSGLSSPVLSFFDAYFVPGHAAAGFQTRIVRQEWRADCTALRLTLRVRTAQAAVLVTLRAGPDYALECENGTAGMIPVHEGTFVLMLKAGEVCLSIQPAARR